MKNDRIKNSIIYNIFPSSYYDKNGDGIGDIKGIIEKIPYIKQIADIIWINPIFKSPFEDGGYDISDYYNVDERFGTLDDIKELTTISHKSGLKILLDLVVGHTSDKHPWFIESKKAERNQYSDYYIWTDEVFEECEYKHISGNAERNGNYLVNFFFFQPSLNFGFAEVKQSWQHHYLSDTCKKIHNEVEQIIKFYLNLGIDGFRVDMANSIVKDDTDGKCSCEVWQKIFSNVKKEYPNVIFISEWGQPKFAVGNGGFDIDYLTHCWNDGYNYLFRNEKGSNIINNDGDSFFRLKGQGEADTFFEYFMDNLEKTNKNGYISVVTGNHDLPRISIGRKDEELKCVFAFILSLPCVPLIYYGDEIGMSFMRGINKDGGYIRTGSRTPMQWSDNKNADFSKAEQKKLYLPISDNYVFHNVKIQSLKQDSLLNTVKNLVEIKRQEKCLNADAEFEIVNNVYPLVLKRKKQNENIIIIINPSNREYLLKQEYSKILISTNADFDSGIIKMKACSYVWLKI